MRKPLTSLVACVVVMAFVAAVTWAGASARLRGTVVDSADNPIANVVITIVTDEVDGFEKIVKVKDNGTFSTLLLDATKTYRFLVEAPGYIPHEREVKVPAGSADSDFTFTLVTEGEMQERERAKVLEQPGYKEMNQGRELLEQGKTAEAEVMLEAAVAAVPDLLPAWIALTDIAFEEEDYAKALERAKECLELDDESLRCLAIASNACQQLGDNDGRAEYLTRYQELNPEDPGALFNQAADFLNKMDDDSARPLLEKCLEADPDFPKCIFEYGMLQLRGGDMEGAKGSLQHYLEVAPDGVDAATAQETIKYL